MVRLEIFYAFVYNFTTLPCEADMKGCTIKHNACRGGFHFLCCRMEDILLGCDMLATRWVLAWGSILWAVFLWWPGDLFPNAAEIAAGKGRTTYALMAQIAPEHI